ncbi:MAG: PAS domain S-box protein, partial [Opitutaceae bacterium]|nr:PAS domain S-box protein [Opitutaceae bacterium]
MSPSPSAPAIAPAELAPWADSLELALYYSLEEGRVLEVNRAFARKFGRVAASWLDQPIVELIHHDDLTSWRAESERLLRPPYHLAREHRWLTAQGWRWIAWEETARRDATGRVVAVRAIGRDVTKHRLAEEHFRKIAQAVEQAPVSIAITTPGGTPQYVNSRYTETTGYTLEEIFEQQIPLLRAGHPSEAAYRRFCAVVASGHKWTGELRSHRKDGSDIWELVQVSPIRDHLDQITSLFCLREDITERKTLEEQLRHAQKMESLGALAGGIAHDFNNIISIVRGFTELAMSLSPGDTQLPRYLNAVHAAALRASALVSQIRAFSLRTPATQRAVDLSALVRDLVGLLGETFPRGIEFDLRLDDSLDHFSADPDQLRQILLNLCVNARDAMPDGGRLLISTGRVAGGALSALGLDPALDYARLRVTDTGMGMPPEIR